MKKILTYSITTVIGVLAVAGVANAQTATPSPTTATTTTVSPTVTSSPTPTGSVQGAAVTVPGGAPATGHAMN